MSISCGKSSIYSLPKNKKGRFWELCIQKIVAPAFQHIKDPASNGNKLAIDFLDKKPTHIKELRIQTAMNIYVKKQF